MQIDRSLPCVICEGYLDIPSVGVIIGRHTLPAPFHGDATSMGSGKKRGQLLSKLLIR